ncbi:Gfo/Idh/MocA family oxidoreductase [Imperialibacter roseus]|uniref:Gfo/Idh/MocA family oxidoreductase n=1 Tax=Imperialibacter roseus TaxID=1324217 RepID=A0ABZ0IIB8_9BACT|nr:Gfo/Idh/MocA family oxidoreductase [Imperialibacter roseus]WOK04411.1 Gfo/Idh/MocA family oxidoreductase [Imperialibacter roseus]
MKYILASIFTVVTLAAVAQPAKKPLKIGVAGLIHGHVGWVLNKAKAGDVEIVGIAESNKALAEKLSKQYGFSMSLVYPTLDEMLAKTKPEAVTAFNDIYGHMEVVEKCAPKGIHVMVEKPLAMSYDHARRMKALADKHKIFLVTNYETTWYATTQETLTKAAAGDLGTLRKVMVNDGHEGPKEIGVGKEFLDWLTDPKLNGAGALIDFGCYGANLLTHLMSNERPLSVTAITQTNKPDIYPKVDDEATILVKYPGTQGVIQASWNWTFGRKDMEVYGTNAYIKTVDGTRMSLRVKQSEPEQPMTLEPMKTPFNDPFDFLTAVIRGETKLNETVQGRLSSLENNMVVVEILDAAIRSAKEGKTVVLER